MTVRWSTRGRRLQVLLELIEHHVEASIAVDVDVQLVAEVPVDAERACEELRIHHPLALVTIPVARH